MALLVALRFRHHIGSSRSIRSLEREAIVRFVHWWQYLELCSEVQFVHTIHHNGHN